MQTSPPYLFHLSNAQGLNIDFAPPSLETDGFVHLSASHQVLRTANQWFQKASELKILVLETEALQDRLKWEDSYQKGEEFPHYYGPLPQDSLKAVAVLSRDAQGQWVWPATLSGLQSPLLDAPTEEAGVIEPSLRFREKKLPKSCVLCFFQEVLAKLSSVEGAERHLSLGSEIGATEVVTLPFKGQTLAVCYPGVGGPLAGATLEELIALGCQNFVLCGGAGSLVKEQTLGHLVVVESALRDEGLSHHYRPASERIPVRSELVSRFSKKLSELGVEHTIGPTWTTDALYRETPSRIARRREAGCLTVEMELASLLAVAQFRGAELGALLYCGDDVGSENWDFRDWTSAHTVRERLFWLSAEMLG